MRFRVARPSHTTVVAYLALFVAMSGTAAAATGGNFILGHKNSATRVSTLANKSGVPLSLVAPPAKSPLRVNSARQVSLLNADLLDGLHERAFARKLCRGGGSDSGMIAATDCTRHLTVTAPLTDNGYALIGATPPAAGGIAHCPFGFAVGGGYILGDSATPDTVLASHPYNPVPSRYETNNWAVRVQSNSANGGSVAAGGKVYVVCVG